MTSRRLTKQIVEALVSHDKDYVVWCGYGRQGCGQNGPIYHCEST
jgi:hypothetical protein